MTGLTDVRDVKDDIDITDDASPVDVAQVRDDLDITG